MQFATLPVDRTGRDQCAYFIIYFYSAVRLSKFFYLLPSGILHGSVSKFGSTFGIGHLCSLYRYTCSYGLGCAVFLDATWNLEDVLRSPTPSRLRTQARVSLVRPVSPL